jgi:hypothetical protein
LANGREATLNDLRVRNHRQNFTIVSATSHYPKEDVARQTNSWV